MASNEERLRKEPGAVSDESWTLTRDQDYEVPLVHRGLLSLRPKSKSSTITIAGPHPRTLFNSRPSNVTRSISRRLCGKKKIEVDWRSWFWGRIAEHYIQLLLPILFASKVEAPMLYQNAEKIQQEIRNFDTGRKSGFRELGLLNESYLSARATQLLRFQSANMALKDAVVHASLSDRTVKHAVGQLLAGWMETLPQLVQGRGGWPAPHALHMNYIAGGYVFEPTKQIVGPACKTLLWWSSSLASMPTHLTDYDFAAIAQEIYTDEARRNARSLEAILDAVALAWNESDVHSGRIVKHPGTPDMYDHERLAYGSPPTEGLAQLLVAAQGLARVVDGFIMPAARCMEPVGVPHCRVLDQKSGQELFTVGSGAHEVCWNDVPPTPPTNAVVKAFVEALIATANNFPNGKDTDLG
ncbi:hypothetical protein FB451DRAFT_1379294 [Mycena latifolia]|nr:hypothetical protein FB451DRAFT_1379294 [Mycena latifolia]